MKEGIRVTVLVENTVNAGGLMAEHGLAYYLQAGEKTILFDTGQTELLIGNSRRLGIDLAGVNTVVLSHGHYDHSSGLKHVLPLSPQARIFLHPDALASKYVRNQDGSARSIGMIAEMAEALRNRPKVHWTTQPTEIGGGIFATGPIPRDTDFEDVGGSFYLDQVCRQPDLLWDDQALFYDSPRGLHVILGCAHAGVINTLQHVRQIAGGKSIYAVMGGMHLLSASQRRLDYTIAALHQIGVQRIGLAHCTGFSAAAALWSAFPGKCFYCSTGSRVGFDGD